MPSVDEKDKSEPLVAESDDFPANSFFSLSSFPPVKAVFHIEKIRKQILFYSSINELLQFRLISREWLVYFTEETMLRSQTRISIRLDYQQPKLIYESSNGKRAFLPEIRKQLDSAISNLFPFPCSTFTIQYGYNIGNMMGLQIPIDDFLNTHGKGIRKLKFDAIITKSCSEDVDRERMCSHQQNWLKKFITKVILKQSPNLVEIELTICFQNSYSCVWGISCEDISQILISLQKKANETWENYNLNLQSVSLDQINDRNQVFEFIKELAPNLKVVKTEHLNFYLESSNRLCFLKKLSFNPGFPNELKKSEIIKKIVNLEGDLQLVELQIVGSNLWNCPEIWNEVTDICNKIFEKSCHSLKKFCWSPLAFLPGLCLPQMSNVKYVYFTGTRNNLEDFFPAGMLLSNIFPKLHTIVLEFIGGYALSDEKAFTLGFNDVIPSVRVIILKRFNLVNLETLKMWFPNANVKGTIGNLRV